MTTTNLPSALSELSGRVRRLEMMVTNSETFYDPNPEFESIKIKGPEGAGYIPIDVLRMVDPPDSFTANAGALYDRVFVDVEIVPPTSGTAQGFWIQIAEKVEADYQLVDAVTVYGTVHRFENLEPDTTYGVKVDSVNPIGITTETINWLDVYAPNDSTIPPAVSNVVLARGATSLVVKFDPLTEAEAADVARGKGQYIVQADTAATFDSSNLRTSTDSSFVRAFNDVGTEETWRARVAPVDASGNQGPWTEAVPITAGGVNNSMILADLSAAKITVGTMLGDRIEANTADIAVLKSSTLAARNITIGAGGNLIIGSPPSTGIYINSQGITLYGGGTVKVQLDAASGNATFRGNIDASTVTGTTITGGSINGTTITGGTVQTASTGARLVIDQNLANRIRFYDVNGTEIGSVGVDHYAGAYRMMYRAQTGGSSGNGIHYFGGSGTGLGDVHCYQLNCNNVIADGNITAQAPYQVYSNGYAVITAGTIGAQSVAYANSAGSAPANGGTATHVSGGAVIGGSNYNHTLASPDNRSGGFFSYCPNYLYMTSGGGTVVRWDSGNGRLYYEASTERFKKNIRPANKGRSKKVLNIQSREWDFAEESEENLSSNDRHYRDNNIPQTGVVAEEVAALDPSFAFYDGEGQPESINWPAITVMLIEEVKKLRADVDALTTA